MGLARYNVVYEGRTRTLYSHDGETWYKDPQYKEPADPKKISQDEGGAFFFVILIALVIGLFVYTTVKKHNVDNKPPVVLEIEE